MKTKDNGFTLIEIMVAMVVLAIGLLGMAAMTVLVMKGSRGANDMTSATNICQLKMEELKDLSWTSLGNSVDRSDVNYKTYGLNAGLMAQERDLNGQGKTYASVMTDVGNVAASADALGPYKYVRTFVVCDGQDYTSGPTAPPTAAQAYVTPTAGQRPQEPDCNIVETTETSRTQWLACTNNDITGAPGAGNKEKKIKVLCTWKDRSGDCHSVHMDTTVVQLN